MSRSVLETMFNNKVEHLLKEGKMLEWRWLMARKQTLFSNLPHEYGVFRPSTMAEFLRDYGFSSVSDEAESGWTPLRFAVLAKDAGVVAEMIAAGADPNAVRPEFLFAFVGGRCKKKEKPRWWCFSGRAGLGFDV